MPIVGVVDPSHREANRDMPGRAPNWYTPEELLQVSRMADPKWSSWTHELIRVALDGYEREHTRVSVTPLLGCPRSSIIERKEDYILAMEDLWPAIRGTQVHRTLEDAARPGALAEVKFITSVNGIDLSCVVDLITPEGDMFDYKVSNKPPEWYPYRSQTLQLMYNAYIVRNADRVEINGKERPAAGFKVPEIVSASIVYLSPDKPKIIVVEEKQDTFAPNGRQIQRKLPYIWTDEEVLEGKRKGEAGLLERAEIFQEAQDIYPKFPKRAAALWGGKPEWGCQGRPYCNFNSCMAKRWPDRLVWDRPDE